MRESLQQDIARIRTTISDRVVLTTGILAIPAAGASVLRAVDIGWRPIMSLHIALAVLAVGAGMLRKRLPLAVKAGYIVALLMVIGIASLWQFGLSSQGSQFFVAIPLVAAMLLGHRAGIATLILSVIVIGLFSLRYLLGPASASLDLTSYQTSPTVWINQAIGLVLIAGILIFALQEYFASLVKALSTARENEQRLAQLTDQLNVRVYERTEQLNRAHKIQALAADIARGFVVSDQPNTVLQKIIGKVLQITESPYAALGHFRVDSQEAEDANAFVIGAEAWAEPPTDSTSSPWTDAVRSVLQQVQRTGEVVVLTELPPPTPSGLQASGSMADSVIGIPLLFENRVVGAVGLTGSSSTDPSRLIDDLQSVWAAVASILHMIREEQARREREERLRILSKAVESSPSLVVVTDSTGRIDYANPRFISTTGHALEDVKGHLLPVLLPDAAISREVWPVISTGQTWHGETSNLRKDGTTYIAEEAVAPIIDETGLPIHFISIQHDVTERTLARDTLAESERRYREMVEAADDSFYFFSLGPDGSVLYGSPNSLDWFGIPQGSLLGQHWSRFTAWTPATVERITAAFRQCLQGIVPPPVALDYLIDGETRHLAGYPHPVLMRGGQVVRVEGILVDLTERMTLETKLHQAVSEAENANRAKSEFLSSMSHELRTPLNAILGFAQMLEFNKAEALSPTQKRCVERILKGGHHLLQLISDILDLSKIEAGHVDLSLETIPLDRLVDECWQLILPLAERQGITVEMASFAGQTAHADFTRLKQVLVNLLSNAIKYNRPNGSVRISSEIEGTRISIAVADTGIGIPEDRRGQLFQPFSRLGQEMTSIEGTGIGLSVTKRLIELMNGSIAFDSTPGIGTTFEVTLPLSQTATEPDSGLIAVETSDVGPMRGTIVYVEDNPANIDLMKMIFSGLSDLVILTAFTGEIGLDLIARHQPDLIILDLNLPGMNGFDVLKHLKSNPKSARIPVFALTAAATKRDLERGKAAGFDLYLTKPFHIQTLVHAVHDILLPGKPAFSEVEGANR